MKKNYIQKWIGGIKRNHLSLSFIVVSAVLLGVTMGVMYYSAQNIIHDTMHRVVEREMNSIYLSIRNRLIKVEVTLDNMAWVVAGDLNNFDALYEDTRLAMEYNSDIKACGLMCIPNLYPEKGYWFEPYSVRRANDSIESMQLGSAEHDYTKMAFFTDPIQKGEGCWSEPYLDSDGARTTVTTYGVPVRNDSGKTVATVAADVTLGWLEKVLDESMVYQSTQRFLLTRSGHLLAGKDNSVLKTSLQLIDSQKGQDGYLKMKDENGDLHHVFYHAVGGKTDWVLISVLSDSEVFGKLRTVRRILSLLILAGLVLLTFIVLRTRQNLERLRQVNAEKNRIGGELRVAHNIQQNMLPQKEIRDERLEVRGSLVPAKEVGGDLFDYFVRDEKLFFCIGDVSGKGAASAMMMAVVQTKFRDFSIRENSPARIMQHINIGCCQNNKTNIFVTLFIGVLDLPTGRLHYCDAGHDCPFVLHNSQCEIHHCEANLPVGVFDDFTYTEQEMQIEPESTLFLYTDGLTEAMNEKREQFRLERVRKVLTDCITQSPKEVLEKVTAAVHGFVKGAEQSDDLTMLVIHYTPKNFKCQLSETLTIKNNLNEVSQLGEFMKAVAKKLSIEKSLARKLQLAVEEAVVNVIEYAYPAETEGRVTINVEFDGNVLKFQIIDTGSAFDPTTQEHADITQNAEERQIGGLGILLVRKLMDSINYERINKQNILTLLKKIS